MGDNLSKAERNVLNQALARQNSSHNEQFPPEQKYLDLQSFKFSAADFIKLKDTKFKDEYILKEVLGRGAFSEVRRVIHKETGIVRAAKILQKKYSKRGDHHPFSEVEILTTLDHANVMRVFEIFEDPTHYYIICEFLGGGELLGKLTKNKRLSERETARIIQQVLSAISYCHSHNIVHRDLKLDNLIFESRKEDSSIKVIDFGFAKTLQPNDCRMKEVLGTCYYIAPEVLKGDYTEKCDIWSIGVITYTLLNGKPPFFAEDEKDVFQRVKSGKFNFNSPVWANISNHCKKFITRLLEMDPVKRCSAQEALKDPWFELALEKNKINSLISSEILEKLQNFSYQSKLQEAIWTFLISFFAPNDEIEKIIETFRVIDSDLDGRITEEDLKQGYIQLMKIPSKLAEEAAKKAMANFRASRSGMIYYRDFLNATVSKAGLLKQDKLVAIFKIFDQDGDGVISSRDLRFVFNERRTIGTPDDFWDQWISQASQNSREGINFETFKEIMAAS